MIKKVIFSLFILTTSQIFSQEGSASPYSFYGIGDMRFKGTVDTRAMAGIGILPDSIHINLQNPALLSEIKLTTFTIGTTFSAIKFKTNTLNEKAQRSTIDYLALAIPLGKLGISFGLMPFSSVGYNIEKSNTNQFVQYIGSGNINKVFLGAGYAINKKWNVGLEMNYHFGITENKTLSNVPNTILYLTRETNKNELGALSINLGTQYKTKIKKYNFISSFTFSPQTNFKVNNTRELARIIKVNAQTPEIETGVFQTLPSLQDKTAIGSKITFGSGIGELKKWFVGFENTFQAANMFPNKYASQLTNFGILESHKASNKIAIGGYYIPEYSSFSNYFKRITYRSGIRHENTGLVINGNALKDTAFTLGFGLPLGTNSFSNFNLGFEVGKRGNKNSGLIQENYMNVSIGLSLNDKWFTKRKID